MYKPYAIITEYPGCINGYSYLLIWSCGCHVARSRGVPALSYGASSVIAIQGVSSFRGAKLQVSIKKKKNGKCT